LTFFSQIAADIPLMRGKVLLLRENVAICTMLFLWGWPFFFFSCSYSSKSLKTEENIIYETVGTDYALTDGVENKNKKMK